MSDASPRPNIHPVDRLAELKVRIAALKCQSAFKTDPLSASKIDPPVLVNFDGLISMFLGSAGGCFSVPA